MNFLVRHLRVSSWPIWVKLFTIISIAVLIPVVAGFFIINAEIRSIDRDNLTAYVNEQGTIRSALISENFNRARADMLTLEENQTYYDLVLQVLTSQSANRQVPPELSEYIDTQLITGGLFDHIVVVDRDGVVILRDSVYAIPAGGDPIVSFGYQAGRDANTLDDPQRLIVRTVNDQVMVIITTVFTFEDQALGYAIGQVDLGKVVVNELDAENALRPTSSYLATLELLQIGLSDFRPALSGDVQRALVNAAFSGQTAANVYDGQDGQYIGYSKLITDTPFALITEASTDITFTLSLTEIFSQTILVVIGVFAIALIMTLMANQGIAPDLARLRQHVRAMVNNDFESYVEPSDRGDEIGRLAQTFVATREHIRTRIEDLEGRVAARAHDLQATQEVSRYAASQRDSQVLMDNVVTSIINQFRNIYHAQIFLIDSDGDFAILRASTGEAGKKLLARGHRLAVGSVSIIGQVTGENRVVVARDTGESTVHRRNEFLLDTRAELAIPLRFGQTIIGALDVQSKEPDSFTKDQISILVTMADQIAIAIENARLYQESVRRLEELATSDREATLHAWTEYMNARRLRVLYSEVGPQTDSNLNDLRAQALDQGVTVVGELTTNSTVPVAIPIQLRGQTLGVVEWELPESDFSYDKVQLGQELVNRLAISLDNARLFQESRRAINRERLVNEIASRLTGQTNIDQILQTAVREVGQALHAPHVNIHLKWNKPHTDEQPTNGHTGNGTPPVE